MGATYSLNMQTTEELEIALADEQLSLEELAPYNGTAPGAAAIASARHRIDAINNELARRVSDN